MTGSVFADYSLENCTIIDNHGIRWMKEGLEPLDFLRTRWRLRRTQPTAQEYLKRYTVDFPWGTLCLKHGQVSKPPTYRTNMRLFKREAFLPSGHCYRNCIQTMRLWQEDPPLWIEGRTLSYVEGLALDPTGIFLHGWIDMDGQAIDLTFERSFMSTYFGVRFDLDWADQTCEKIDKFGIFHNWEKSRSSLEAKLLT